MTTDHIGQGSIAVNQFEQRRKQRCRKSSMSETFSYTTDVTDREFTWIAVIQTTRDDENHHKRSKMQTENSISQ
jgi:hypothetical protein